jgi:aryl-alcohol dehydrogenase-like predicted oxidoreductase
MNSCHRLALGTVQFGIPYGVANQSGQVDRDEVAKILNQAYATGLDTVDTAIAYGQSEQRLGDVGIANWNVITKLAAMPGSVNNVRLWVKESVSSSFKRLGVSRVRGLLLHHSNQLFGPQGEALYQALNDLKEQGMVEKIGVSIYAPEELDAIWPRFKPDLVQSPFNIFDRRLAVSGWLKRLHNSGTEIHVRSVFLQGLLLMERNNRPKYFNRWNLVWDQWHNWLDEQSITPLQACLGFTKSQPEINRVVVGVDSLKQLQEILTSFEAPTIDSPIALMSKDMDLINPSRWEMS